MIINDPLALNLQHYRAGCIGKGDGFDIDRNRRRFATIREKGARDLVGIFELGDGAAGKAGRAKGTLPAPWGRRLVDKRFHALFEETLENPAGPKRRVKSAMATSRAEVRSKG